MFYDRFAYLCKQKGVSVSRGALEAGISKSLVTKWKTNNTDIPSPDVIGKLSKYFGLPVSELLAEKEQPADSGELSDIKARLIQYVYPLTDEQAALALRVLKSILEDAE